MHVHTSEVGISQCNSIANNEKPPPQFDETIPGRDRNIIANIFFILYYFFFSYFSYYCKYGILVFDHDGTGPADESKRTKRVQGWSRQIVGGEAFHYLQYYYTVK